MTNDNNIAPFSTHFFLDAFDISGDKIMGRQAAGNSYLNALFRENFDEISLYISDVNNDPRNKINYDKIVNFLNTALTKTNDPKVNLIPYDTPLEAERFGGIFRPDPVICELAYHRGYHGHDSYSIVGITHTTASHEIMGCIKDTLVAPLMPWDAIICTSEAVKSTVSTIMDDYYDFLSFKIGASRKPEFQLPVIPLGINIDDFKIEADKKSIRESFGIDDDDIVILFVGRLSFHAKAHNIPMFLALENISKNMKESNIHFIMTGWFPNDDVKEMYNLDAKLYCPSINIIFLDGRDQSTKFKAFNASDIFFSLTDNIQETFGLTPLEGMAAGLPVVVSDWNGYKDTVRDGIDGFRIPTTSYPEDLSTALAYRYDIGLDSYDRYCGYHSQFTSVNIVKAIEKLRLLIEDKELRTKFGLNAKKYAKEKFNWSSILRSYTNLKNDLQNIRKDENKNYSKVLNKISSDRLPPYKIFNSYPTNYLNIHNSVKLLKNINNIDYRTLFNNSESVWYAKIALPQVDQVEIILNSLNEHEYESIASLADKINFPTELVIRIVALLLKYGYVIIEE
tara:strand:- start:16576 stop:18273 length:1698 start_codon:yes stop_codon:yes gene_type:complete